MSFVLKEQSDGHVIEMTVSGALTKEAYQEFVPLVEAATHKYGKVRVLLVMMGFHGWDAGVQWEDSGVAIDRFEDIERLAIVGETVWEQGSSMFCRPFTGETIRYLSTVKLDAARSWVQEGLRVEVLSTARTI